jgi:hypothetical protein
MFSEKPPWPGGTLLESVAASMPGIDRTPSRRSR